MSCRLVKTDFRKLGMNQQKTTTTLYDNNCVMKLWKNLIMHDHSKYIDVRFHFLQELTKKRYRRTILLLNTRIISRYNDQTAQIGCVLEDAKFVKSSL